MLKSEPNFNLKTLHRRDQACSRHLAKDPDGKYYILDRDHRFQGGKKETKNNLTILIELMAQFLSFK